MLEAPAEAAAADWHVAVEFYPPQRSGRQLKVRASVETATGLFINDTEPQITAVKLRLAATPRVAESEVPEVARQQ